MELSIIVPRFNISAANLELVDKINEIIGDQFKYEIIIVYAGTGDDLLQSALSKGVIIIKQIIPGFGNALRQGIKAASGKYILTMDADSSNPYLIKRMLDLRQKAHIVIASRYVALAVNNNYHIGKFLSYILNRYLSILLSIPVRDLLSDFRLYNREVFTEIVTDSANLDIQIEIIAKAYMQGFLIQEIPFHFHRSPHGVRHFVSRLSSGMQIVFTGLRRFKIRNTSIAADYDERAFYSLIPPQKFWQRKKYDLVCKLGNNNASRILDAGCGSAMILKAFPQAIGLDIDFKKLRYNLRSGNLLVNADLRSLCFKDVSFDMVICSEVVEHLPKEMRIFTEFKRVVKPGGILIIVTPDYSRLSWNIIEWLYLRLMPHAYGREHITHYSRDSLKEILKSHGFKMEAFNYILGSDLVCRFKKTE